MVEYPVGVEVVLIVAVLSSCLIWKFASDPENEAGIVKVTPLLSESRLIEPPEAVVILEAVSVFYCGRTSTTCCSERVVRSCC